MVRLYHFISRLVLGLMALAILGSCDFLAPPVLSIIDYGPHADSVEANMVPLVWVEFSRDVDHGKAENAFSLKENGTVLSGTFLWDGKRLMLAPFRPLASGQLYELAVGMAVEDSTGVSMEREFLKRFSTKAELGRPSASLRWKDGSAFNQAMAITDRQPILHFEFTEPVDRTSFYGAFSLSPAPRFSFDWAAADTVCEIRPLEPFAWQTDYHVSLQDSLRDLAGNTVTSAIDRWFHVGNDLVPPVVTGVWNLVSGTKGTFSLLERGAVADSVGFNSLWERDWGMELDFSEPVQRNGIEGLITIEPPLSFSIPNSGDLVDHIMVLPSSRWAGTSLYSLTIRPGIKDAQDNVSTTTFRYRFYTDGPLTVSPRLTALALRTNPADASPASAVIKGDHSTDYQVINLGAFTPNATTRTYVDLYFSLAAGAGIDALSVLANFSVTSTNSCVSIIPVAYQSTGIMVPPPQRISGTQVMRVFLDVTNQVSSGLVVFRLHGGFQDSRGNIAETDGIWPVLK